MPATLLEDRATLYLSGDMPELERGAFEVLLAFDPALRAHVAAQQETVAVLAIAPVASVAPPPDLKDRLLRALAEQPAPVGPEAQVVTDPGGHVLWVNPAFTELCGYTLDELKGSKPGARLQGTGTDPVAVDRIRAAIRERRPCRQTLVNYHKLGSPYRVDVRITPFLDDAGVPLWFIAQERKLSWAESEPGA